MTRSECLGSLADKLIRTGTTRLADVVHNEEIQLEDVDFAGSSRLGRLNLAAGEGTILAIEQAKEADR